MLTGLSSQPAKLTAARLPLEILSHFILDAPSDLGSI
jgi:hypothetical protein